MIFASAGHIDHGKTALLQALTGHNADRLPEEKKRGMTIDLGYVYLPLADGRVLGFVDVPGHEKFLANMLCGLSGIPHALLVVAADDGIMPQTREHLAILQLSGIAQLSVVISKCDLVDQARLQQVTADIRQLLQASRWAAAPLFVVSSHSGEGIAGLRQHLLQQSSLPDAAASLRFRLAIDRAFTLSGAGLVVTGTALGGRVAVGDKLWLTGRNVPVRVRSLHVQNASASQGQAGQRIALNLVGDVEKQQVQRGDWLLATAPPPPSQRITIALQAIAPLKHWQAVHIHHAARHTTGRLALLSRSQLEAGAHTLAELTLEQPLWLADGDRLILRDASARDTIAGAQVLELQPPTRGKRLPERLEHLQQLQESMLSLPAKLAVLGRQQAVMLDDFAWANQLPDHGMQALLQHSDGQQVADRLYAVERWAGLQQKLLDGLARLHQQHPDQLGASRGRLRRLALPGEPEATVNLLLEQLLQQGSLRQTRGWLHLPQHVLAFTPQEEVQWQQLAPHFANSSEPHWVRDLAAASGMEEETLRQLLRKAARLGHVLAVVPDRYFAAETVQGMADIVRQLCQQHGHADAASFRNQLACGRKLAIQILEFFDRSGFTRRLGDRHLLRENLLFAGHSTSSSQGTDETSPAG
ncbi:selenocysteine-specific translation elongation factor [Aquitalea sp. ASV15]|uniref:selenocysteine-specific translation elongation factor n=1 Tax=Aquitalea sp. ASV15 TaxID=2795104 RepID=UPI0018ED0BF4|nr:selenocysteine-specific translation elongation factor [Aquitalea sp. ASV15]